FLRMANAQRLECHAGSLMGNARGQRAGGRVDLRAHRGNGRGGVGVRAHDRRSFTSTAAVHKPSHISRFAPDACPSDLPGPIKKTTCCCMNAETRPPLKAAHPAYFTETVEQVHHWTDRLFSFRCTR